MTNEELQAQALETLLDDSRADTAGDLRQQPAIAESIMDESNTNIASREKQVDDAVHHTPPERFESSTSAKFGTDAALMPPPSAPASMLFTIKPTNAIGKRHGDPFICTRLIAVAVTLFRQGKAKEAKALAQFTVDTIEGELWIKYLHTYMGSETESVDVTFAHELVEEAREELQKIDPVRAGFLGVLRDLIQ